MFYLGALAWNGDYDVCKGSFNKTIGWYGKYCKIGNPNGQSDTTKPPVNIEPISEPSP